MKKTSKASRKRNTRRVKDAERKRHKRDDKKRKLVAAQEDYREQKRAPAPPKLIRVNRKPRQEARPAPVVPQLRVAQKIPGE